MEITRTINGVTVSFTLTSDELYKAFLEQRGMFDKENVEEMLAEVLSNIGKSELYNELSTNDSFITNVAALLRIHLDKYEMDFNDAMKKAVEETCALYEMNKLQNNLLG